jgi:hypothetical protein
VSFKIPRLLVVKLYDKYVVVPDDKATNIAVLALLEGTLFSLFKNMFIRTTIHCKRY